MEEIDHGNKVGVYGKGLTLGLREPPIFQQASHIDQVYNLREK